MKSFIECECLSELMKQNYGAKVNLTFGEARQLSAQNHVRIIDGGVSKKTLEDTNYMFRYKFSKRRISRVAWIQNYSKDGGAEISNYRAVRAGSGFGFDVVGIDIEDLRNAKSIFGEADVLIVNNLHATTHDVVIENILASGVPHVVYSHDCLETSVELFRRAALNVFISPRHMAHYVALCGSEIIEKSIVLPIAFDADRWPTKADGRIPGSVFVANYDKCRDNTMAYVAEHPELKFYIAGDVAPFGKNVERVAPVPHEEMEKVFHKYETLLHLPDHLCAGDRVLFEAVLCRCEVITNENAGHSSWSEKFDWRDAAVLRPILRQATTDFWRAVEGVLK